MALMTNSLPSFPFTTINNLPSSNPVSFHGFSHRFKLFSLFSSLSTSSSLSTPSIFLPFLEEEEEEEEEEETSIEEHHEEFDQERDQIDDPIYRFFKSRSSTQDPPRESKLSLQKNCRTSWHLADDLNSIDEIEPETLIELKGEEIGGKDELGFDGSSNIEGIVGEIVGTARNLPGNRRTSWHLADELNSIEEIESETLIELKGEEIVEKDELGFDGSSKIEGIVGEIVGIARNLAGNSTLGEHMGVYEGRVGEKECVEVLGLLCEEGLVMSCLYFYEWMGLQEPSLVTPRACSVLFPALGKCGMGDKLMILWCNLPNTREFRDVHVYNAAISGLLSSGRYEDAWKVYEAMEMNNILPDRVTGSVMITIMRKEGKSAKDAWEFFERMNRKGVKWSSEVIGALIKSFCDEGLQKQALIIQAEMEKKGISSNTIIYNTLMDAYCKSNQIEEAEGLFSEMKAKKLSPSSASYNILMDAYSKRMQPEIVEKLLEEMQNSGLQPNVKSYTSLISSYGRQKMSDMASDAFLRMKKVGIKPTSYSYTALIHAYSVSGWHEKAYKAFENMNREGIKPSIETYTALLDAFRRAGDVKTLMLIWKSMIRDKVEGTRVTFNILLDGFAKQGHYVEARDVVSEFGKLGFQPTVMTYNMLINAYARGGQHLKLPQLLNEMTALGLKPDSITYSTMIYAFVRVRDFKRAFFYHKQMVKSGQVPDVKSYEKLRAILDVKAAIKNKKDKSAILGIINSKMGLLKAKKKGKKDEFWKNKRKHGRTHGSTQVGL